MDRRIQRLWVAAAAVMLPLAAHAEDLMLRIRQTQTSGSTQYEVIHAQTGQFAHQPPLPDKKDGDLIVIGRDAQGRELFRAAVRSPNERNAEAFDPKTGAIVTARKLALPSATVEVRVPYPAGLASVDLVEQNAAAESRSKTAGAPTPQKRLSRQEVDAIVTSSAGKSRTTRSAGTTATAAATPASTVLWDSGPTASRMDIIVVGDGYASADAAKWVTDAQTVVNGILADPLFSAYRHSFNIRRVDVVSPESGVSENFGAIPRKTAFNTVIGCYNIARLVCADATLLNNAVAAATAPDGRDLIVLVANSATYGGSGGSFAALTMHRDSIQIALHEIGHTAFQLADEYEYGTCDNRTEPSEANATIQLDRARAKWGWMIGSSTPIPTQPGIYANGTLGLFTGGKYCTSGIYRPTENSRMRTLGQPWHAVNERRADQVFNYYDPGYIVTGTLSGTGVVGYYPTGTAYYSRTGGMFRLDLTGQAGTNFDLTLYKWNGSSYTAVAQSRGSTSTESIRYLGTAGYYYAEIRSAYGKGNYSLIYRFPN